MAKVQKGLKLKNDFSLYYADRTLSSGRGTIDTSGFLEWQLSQDVSIIINYNLIQDLSIFVTGLTGVTKIYVDGSLATRDASITKNIFDIDILDASIVRTDIYQGIQDISIASNIKGAINVGDGSAGVFAGITSDGSIRMRELVGVGAAQVLENGNTIEISLDASFSGEVNTASNIGSGIGVFSNKVAQDLEFKSLNSSTGEVIIITDASNIYLDVSIAQDPSILENINEIAQLDSSIVRLDAYDAIQDISIAFKVSQSYVDSSLAQRDISLNYLFDYDVIQDVSIALGGGDVNKAYVDSSLAQRDISLNYLFSYDAIQDISIASIPTLDQVTTAGASTNNYIGIGLNATVPIHVKESNETTQLGKFEVGTNYTVIYNYGVFGYRNPYTFGSLFPDGVLDITTHDGTQSRTRIKIEGVQSKIHLYEHDGTKYAELQPSRATIGSFGIENANYKGGYAGFAIGLSTVFAHGDNSTGIYDGLNDQWLFNSRHGGEAILYYDGVEKIITNTAGAIIKSVTEVVTPKVLYYNTISGLITYGDSSSGLGVTPNFQQVTLEGASTNINIEIGNGINALKTNYDVGTDSAQIYFNNTDSISNNYIIGYGSGNSSWPYNLALKATDTSGNISFFTGGFLSINERMHINNIGNIGIGIISPDVSLHIRGSVKIENLSENITAKNLYYNTTSGLITYGDPSSGGGVSQAYVDSSLAQRDASILQNIVDIFDVSTRLNTQDASILQNIVDIFDVSTRLNTQDPSIVDLFTYDLVIDSSIIRLDASIFANINEIAQLDSSIIRLDAYDVIQDVSISLGGSDVNKAYVDTSLGKRDTSLNYLYDYNVIQDISIGIIPTLEEVTTAGAFTTKVVTFLSDVSIVGDASIGGVARALTFNEGGFDISTIYEASFGKNTGFNKNLGTSAGTVSEGDHTHVQDDITDLETQATFTPTLSEQSLSSNNSYYLISASMVILTVNFTLSSNASGNTFEITNLPTAEKNTYEFQGSGYVNPSGTHKVTSAEISAGKIHLLNHGSGTTYYTYADLSLAEINFTITYIKN